MENLEHFGLIICSKLSRAIVYQFKKTAAVVSNELTVKVAVHIKRALGIFKMQA